MKVIVKSFLTFRNAMGGIGSLEIEGNKLTIRDVLDKLANRSGRKFTDIISETERMGEAGNIKILVNGRYIGSLSERHGRELKDGDEICIFPPMAGG